MNKQESLDRIDRALTRHQRHHLEESKNSDCDFHKEIFFPSPKVECDLKEGERVTAEISLSLVRNGFRRGDIFVTDQGDEFKLSEVVGWFKK